VAGREAWAAGVRDADELRRTVCGVLATEPLAQPEYVSCADAETLAEVETVGGAALLSLAVLFGRTRLIDNELLAPVEG
jgi:pantoate--beta-alanine ligase